MNVIPDRPSLEEIERLSDLAATEPIDRGRLVMSLREIEEGLRQRGRGLDRAGGLLDDEARAGRMSLAREDDRLRAEVSLLLRDVEDVRRSANEADESELRQRITSLLAGLRGHRDAEASLILESTATEVGAGD